MSDTLDEDRIKALAYTLRNSGVMPLSTRDALRELTERWEKEDKDQDEDHPVIEGSLQRARVEVHRLLDENARLRDKLILEQKEHEQNVLSLRVELERMRVERDLWKDRAQFIAGV